MLKLSSLKKLQSMHQALGGNKNGFYLTRFGYCMTSNKPIYEIDRIAYHIKPSANWSTKLVRGRVSK